MFRWYFHPVADSYLVVVAAALLLLALLWLGPGRSRVTPRRRAVLAGLRLAIILLVVVAMLRPTLVYTTTKKQSATLLLLADKSRSMSVPDEINGRTRWEAERGVLADAGKALGELARDFEIKAYSFDGTPHPLDATHGQIALEGEPDGQQTAIGSVLDDVLREQAGKRLLGVVLLSDGAQRALPPRDVLAQTSAGRLKHLGVPLFALRFGQARGLGQTQDVAVTELLADQNVFVKNELNVRGQIRVDGYVNRAIPVKLLVESAAGKVETVGQENIQATTDGQLIAVRFSYIPQEAGEYKLTLETPPQLGELGLKNNRSSTFVNVLKGGLNVLYLEGVPRAEMGFLNRALRSSADIKIDVKRIDPYEPKNRPGDMAEWFKPGKFDVYILGDLDSSIFQGTELADLAAAVRGGAGLIMLGGLHSFGAGGYSDTPLAAVLPVPMDPLERQRLEDSTRSDLHLEGPVKMKPTSLGQRHFALRLGGSAQESAGVWAKLPPFKQGANRFTGWKPKSQVLAASEDNQPLLVAHQVGEGRVMAFAADSTWLWVTHGFEAAHKRFWRQIVLWLAKKDEATEGNVWVKLPQRRFGPGQPVEFTVGAHSPTGEPIKNALYQIEVERPDGKRQPISPVHGAEQTSATLRDTQPPGDYTLHVTATQDGKEIGTAHSRFLVYEQDLELDNAAADAAALESLATITGGKSLAPEDLPELIRSLLKDTSSLQVQIDAKETFWDTWPFFLVLIGLMGAEWYLRKRWGLV